MLDTGADETVISQSDYRRAGSPPLDASTKRLVCANDNVLQALGTYNGRLSQGGAVVDEDIYVISGQRRSLLSRRACDTPNLVKLVAVDSVETTDYYKDNNPKLFGGLGECLAATTVFSCVKMLSRLRCQRHNACQFL